MFNDKSPGHCQGFFIVNFPQTLSLLKDLLPIAGLEQAESPSYTKGPQELVRAAWEVA